MEFSDQLNRRVTLQNFPPKRIISLVPSQTELLHALGLGQEVVGITKFCIHPQTWFTTKARVGGTKKIDPKKISSLQPDLIIANKEENEKRQIEELMQLYPVWVSDVKNFDDALEMITGVGEITDRGEKSAGIVEEIKSRFEELKNEKKASGKKAAYFIWKDPYMVAGKNTFVDNMLQKCGFINAVDGSRYREISVEELKKLNPEIVFLSSEPFPFKEKHIAEFKSLLPGARAVLADGEMFSWYGSRLLKAPEYFKSVMNTIS